MPITRRRPAVGLAAALLLLFLALALSLTYGHVPITLQNVLDAVTQYDGSTTAHIIVRTVRIPRALIAMLVGSSLGVAGALMQALTRNPLASPGTLGVNAGAAALVVLAVFLFRLPSLTLYAWFAFAGAGLSAGFVYMLAAAGRRAVTPLRLTVAGAAVTALLSSVTQAVMVVNERTLDEIRFWLAGSVAGRDFGILLQVLPYMLVGLGGAFALARQITILSLGEDVAKGLGQRTGWIKGVAVALIVLLAGSAVAAAGPIGFVGLAVPHLARWIAGTDYRWVLPYAAVLGAVLLLLADVGARFIIRPEEVPVGVMTALIGAPFFIYLARKEVKRG
ncbi:MAG TPA: iron ABC transporter permease [Symbiobacteriaceae bacterium]|nr:iron ABC transporter permease [Symbiobacteriaceae bacterium]